MNYAQEELSKEGSEMKEKLFSRLGKSIQRQNKSVFRKHNRKYSPNSSATARAAIPCHNVQLVVIYF